MKNILITICARGGSKGIPGKNIKIIGGRPLISYTVDKALEFSKAHSAEIVLSTDSSEIKKVVNGEKVNCEYKRPEYLANDTAGKPEAIKDVLLWAERYYNREFEYVIDLDVTSPLRTLEDIEECLNLVNNDKRVLTSFSVSPCQRNPYFNMVEEKSDGFCKVVLGGQYKSRQSAPKVYDMNASIYVYRRAALDIDNPRAINEYSKCYVMDHPCFDLDEPWDFEFMDFLISNNKVSNLI